MNYRKYLSLLLLLIAIAPRVSAQQKQPNFIIILADDLGYGDLGCYGHPTIRTPNIDKLAQEGIRFTQFYVAANVCSPSRAGLLTGRLPVRTGITGGLGVFFPNSSTGLPTSEITIAKALKTKGYQTGIVGKWHLGSKPEYLPNNYGFDEYVGIPYSNDMIPGNKNIPYPPLPLYHNKEVLETNPDQHQLTKKYTDASIDFIKKHKDQPFFLYYPNNAPHVPLYASADFDGKSKRGTYGDVVQEFDWSVGRIIQTLKDLKLEENTFVLFLSDNGPWLTEKENGGSAGLLADGKASTYEGGMRVPAIGWWPKTIQPAVSTSLASSLDLLPTILHWAGAALPADRPLDGYDIGDLFTGKKEVIREIFYYYNSDKLFAIRKGAWKASFTTHSGYDPKAPEPHDPPLLYNLENDPSEKYDLSAAHPDLVNEFKKLYTEQVEKVKAVPSELGKFEEGPIKEAFEKLIKQRAAQEKLKQD